MKKGYIPKHKIEKFKKSLESDSDESGSEHELTHYTGNRIKLMRKTLKLVKFKKLMNMTPDCIKDLPLSQVKSLLLEELLGISNKRLCYILAGKNLEVESSSSESDLDDVNETDVISLDDITDSGEICISEDNCMEIQLSERERLEMEIERPKIIKPKQKYKRVKSKLKKTHIKEEKTETIIFKKEKNGCMKKKLDLKNQSESKQENPLMNVLNLLELQARARAIRSQLANETLVSSETSVANELSISNESAVANETVLPNIILINKSDETVNDSILESQDFIENASNMYNSDENDSSNSVIYVSAPHTPVVTVNSYSESELESEHIVQTETSKQIENNTVQNFICNQEKVNDDFANSKDDDVLIVTEPQVDDFISTNELNITQKDSPAKKTPIETNKLTDNYTWKSRWLESQKIKDVMRTTKLYNNIRQCRRQKINTADEAKNINTKNYVKNKKIPKKKVESDEHSVIHETSPEISNNLLNVEKKIDAIK